MTRLVFDPAYLAKFVQHNGALSGIEQWIDKISGDSCATEADAINSAFTSLNIVHTVDIRVDYQTDLLTVQNLFASL